MSVKNIIKTSFLLSVVVGFSQAQAATFGFGCISNNLAGDCSIGEAQLFVDVTDAGAGQVLFTFTNTGTYLSSITDVYFDDGTLLGIASIDDSDSGVSFSQGASPGNLPAGNNASPPFLATAGFTADSNPAVQPNGVNPGEYLGITFDLLSGVTYADTINALQSGTDLRIGIHVQGFASGGSESFVNTVPVPAAVWLFGSGLLGLVAVSRRKA